MPSPARRIGTTSGLGCGQPDADGRAHGRRDLDRLDPDVAGRLVGEQGHQLVGQPAERRGVGAFVPQCGELVGDQGMVDDGHSHGRNLPPQWHHMAVSYFTAVLARHGRGWRVLDLDVDDAEDLDELADLVRNALPGAGPGLAIIEREDSWFALVRVDDDGEPRPFVSDLRESLRSRYAVVLESAADIDIPADLDGLADVAGRRRGRTTTMSRRDVTSAATDSADEAGDDEITDDDDEPDDIVASAREALAPDLSDIESNGLQPSRTWAGDPGAAGGPRLQRGRAGAADDRGVGRPGRGAGRHRRGLRLRRAARRVAVTRRRLRAGPRPGVRRVDGSRAGAGRARDRLRRRARWARSWSMPAGAVLGAGVNRREADGDPTAHAEILALRAAARDAGGVAAGRLHAGRDPRAVPDVRRGPGAGAGRRGWSSGPGIPRPGRPVRCGTCVRDRAVNHRVEVVPEVRAEECSASCSRLFSRRAGSGSLLRGGVSERPKEHASKACDGATRPWVQIPPPPPQRLCAAVQLGVSDDPGLHR